MQTVKNIIATFSSRDMDDFQRKAAIARESGATHITISQIEKSRWMWERDLTDPYPNWSMLLTSLFKIIVPPELSAWLPMDFAERNFNLLKRRMEILKKLGLKAALTLGEPFVLPEEVFRAHPDWRGPRCDHPRRARNACFSPCVDNPEVLALYETAMYRLYNEVPADHVFIYTNDSGGGLCWSSGLYSGANGPEHCRHRSQADRVTGFLQALQNGASRTGVEAWIEIDNHVGIKAREPALDAMWPGLAPRQAVNGRMADGRPMSVKADLNNAYQLMPVKNVAMPVTFLRLLANAVDTDAEFIMAGLDNDDFDSFFHLLSSGQRPLTGMRNRAAALTDTAERLAGSENADRLTEVWEALDRGYLHYQNTGIEGLVSCCVNQRWLNRPFVLFPAELTAEETEYYRPFQFQAAGDSRARDLLDIQGTSFIRGYSGAFLATSSLNRAIREFEQAIACLETFSFNDEGEGEGKVNSDDEKENQIRLYADRIRLLIAFFRNMIHAIQFQTLVDRTDFDRRPVLSGNWPETADGDLLEYERLIRAEIDNTERVIALIDGREQQMLDMAPVPELEDVFWFNPELTGQLHKKIEIMWNHLLDGKRIFKTNNL